MFTKTREFIVTKQQLINILNKWEATAEIPKVGIKSVVCWPMGEFVEITKIKYTGDKKCFLYKIDFFINTQKLS